MIARLMFATTALIALTPTPGAAQAVKPDPKNRQFTYFLPRTSVAVTITQRIAACPVPDPKDPTKPIGLVIKTYIAPGSETYADPKAIFKVDARAGFLSKRSTKLVLRPDGTLESMNVSSEGQGGELIGSVITVAATVGSWLMPAVAMRGGGPQSQVAEPDRAPKYVAIRCRQEMMDALERLDVVRADIGKLESRIVDGKASATDTTLLQLRRDEEVELMGQLTLKAGEGIAFDPDRGAFAPVDAKKGAQEPPNTERPGKNSSVPTKVTAAPRYEKWFERLADDQVSYVPAEAADVALHFPELPGRHGFVGTLKVDQAMYDALEGLGPYPSLLPPEPTDPKLVGNEARDATSRKPKAAKITLNPRFIYYRRPVPVMLAVKPCSAPVQNGKCEADDAPGPGLAKSATFRLPQLSGLFGFSIGEGGIFGTREAAVKVDATGAPIALEYGSGSGGAQIAGVVDKGLAGATLMRDAQLAATKRSIEAITAERELAELLASRPAN